MTDRGRTGLGTRVLTVFVLVSIAVLGLVGLLVDRSAREALQRELGRRMENTARLAADFLPADATGLPTWASSVAEASGMRVTLIDLDGRVVADSHADPAEMENHGSRPEVRAAGDGEIGISRRVSVSTGFEQLYLALPTDGGLITRVSMPTRVIEEELSSVRATIAFAALLAGLLGSVVVALLSRRIARSLDEITAQARLTARGRADVSPRRSPIRELDDLSLAVSDLAEGLGERLSRSEEGSQTLEVVLGAIPQGTILVDRDDRVVYANPSSYAVLGAVPDHLQGLSPFPFQTAVREARDSREPVVRTVDHGKPARRLRAMAVPFSEDDRVLLLVGDVTERERADAIRHDFVANASHELRTPVATIIASAEALQMAVDRGDGSAAGFARRIELSARQLDRMVADLLDLSRLEGETPDVSAVRLDHVTRDEVDRIGSLAADKEVTLDFDSTPAPVAGNHRDLATAVRNLLENALRYTDEGGRITVRVGTDGDHAVLTIEDDGEGIPIRDLGRVFERFYRVDSARSRATGGTGLGLSIVKHVAESHGGSVEVESELGVGSTFTFRVPVADSGEAPSSH
ncbi:MAG: ATP-binding protein [Acidimicrobiia bacterium]